MEMPELPRRIYTLGEEPPAVHSISYHTCWALHAALKKALHDDKYEELKESKLGVFIKFQELGFDWASRLVHYMLGFQLDIKKKYELWSLVGPQPLTSFWEMLGVHVEAGPSTQEIIAAFERCEGWSRDDRKQLAYLAIFTGYIEGRKYSTPTRVTLQVWVYTALPELGATYGNPLPNNPSPPILAYKGRKGRRQFKEAILSQTRVINFVQKDIGQMFPKLEFDVEDKPAENIIELMFVKKPWKEGLGTCLKEIKYLSERVEDVEKKVGITTKRKGASSQNTTSPPKPTLEPALHLLCFLYLRTCVLCLYENVNGTNAGRKSLAEDKGLDVPADASSSKDKAPEPSLQSPYTANSTARVIIPNKNLYPGYNPFAPIDKKKLKELADWLKTCPHYRTPLDKKQRKSRTWWYQILRTSLEWLEDCRYDANPQHFKRDRMCFLDHLFAQQWRFNFKDFKDSQPDQNGLGRRLPGGAWNYYAGTIPSFCQSNKVWGTDIDDIYAPVNYTDTCWIAMWISIPKRHIVVFDSICSSISPEELDVVMKPFLYMVSYLLVECASSDEQCAQYSVEPFTYERPTNIPPSRAGDCGVYTLKYIECHALGFSKKDFTKANGKTMRDKMAVDIFQELPDAHEFENKDNDANLGAYEG
uniref:Ubiquitin-like protease family profile domain-containing protein n=1 Tax=Brassica oleracea TaxID=3712 RepID=A0A3P6CLC5_BRAOL|nr:unnamed protein product [Brassica oleracea]